MDSTCCSLAMRELLLLLESHLGRTSLFLRRHTHLDALELRWWSVIEPVLQVMSIAHSQHVAVPLVKSDAWRSNGKVVVPKSAANNVADHTFVWDSVRGGVGIEDNVMAWRFVVVLGHPEPQGRLEWYDWILFYQVRVLNQVLSNGLAGKSVVEVAIKKNNK